MASLRIAMAVGPDDVVSKDNITVDPTPAAPAAGELVVGWANGVQVYRQIEILNTIDWLWNGVKERGLLNAQFAGAILITVVDINIRSTDNRRTSSSLTLGNNDIFLGIGVNLTTQFGNGATQMLDSAFLKLREYVKENLN